MAHPEDESEQGQWCNLFRDYHTTDQCLSGGSADRLLVWGLEVTTPVNTSALRSAYCRQKAWQEPTLHDIIHEKQFMGNLQSIITKSEKLDKVYQQNLIKFYSLVTGIGTVLVQDNHSNRAQISSTDTFL